MNQRQARLRIRQQIHRLRVPGFILLLAILAACTGERPAPEATAGTGIAVAPQFADFYRAYGGLALFGYPITGAFDDEASGRTLQYFQRLRLEFDEKLEGEGRIIVAPLGEWALAGLRPSAISALPVEASQERLFAETGLTVSNGFLAFYEANQGERLLGAPISPLLDEGGQRVQYFRNARLEWRPEAPLNYRVQLSLLGQAHFWEAGVAYRYNVAQLARPEDQVQVERVNVTAAVKAPILYQGDEQVIYIQVTSPEGRPVSGIVVIALLATNGQILEIELGVTGDQGEVQAVVPLASVEPGQRVQIQIAAVGRNRAVDNSLGITSVAFMTWW
jgi:hypothetical protein